MKKTLIASAVAAATISSFAMAEATAPEFYGNIQLVHSNEDMDNGDNSHEFKDTGSTLGLKHSHELDSGVTVFAKAELEFDADEDHSVATWDDANGNGVVDAGEVGTAKDNGLSLDEAYVGFKGGFGSVQVGKDETVYDWIDVTDLSDEFGIGGGKATQEEGDNIQYTLEAAEGLMVGVTYPLDSDNNFGGALAAQYSQDMFTVAFSYALGRKEEGAEVGDTIGLGGSFTMDALTINAQLEMVDDSTSAVKDGLDYYALQGVYTMGANAFRLGYALESTDTNDTSAIELAVVHTMSENTYVYVESVFESTDPDAGNGEDNVYYAFGVNYSF